MFRPQFLRRLDEAYGSRPFLRFIIPIIILSSAKLLAGFFLFQYLRIDQNDSYWMTVSWGDAGENNLLVSEINQSIRWPYLFLGWDSGWYLSILAKGYAFSSQSYAFFPAFPIFTWLLNLVVKNLFVSAALFSSIIGIAWLPIYQVVAENYMDKHDALKSTLLYGFSPYVFLFTSVVYGEGVFLLATLGAWLFFKKKMLLLAGVFASIAAVSRPPGIVIMVPILFEVINTIKADRYSIRRRDLFCLMLPFISFTIWLFYCKLTVGNWLAPFTTTYWSDMYSFFNLVLQTLSQNSIHGLFENMNISSSSLYYSITAIIFIIFPPIMIHHIFKKEKSIAIYSTSYFLGILAFGNLTSIPRFISFFPFIWMLSTPRTSHARHSNMITIATCALFYVSAIILWYFFLNGIFIS